MYKYNSFKEYIQLNYIETIQDALELYIKQKELTITDEDTNVTHTYDDFQINTIWVTTVHYTKNKKNYWVCKCDCRNICFVPTTYLTIGITVSCGCKNEENKVSFPNLDCGLVDGTMLCGIKKDRKLNKNNTSGVRGVHFDKDRGLWVAQIMFQRKAHILGRFKTKREAVKARLAGEEEYFGKYR